MTQKQIKVYESEFEVAGTGEFPFDMLRYDTCMPARESDAHAMGHDTWDTRKRVVRLRRLSPTTQPPTVARWQSLGWRVLDGLNNEP